jgi:acyl-CoA thioester hydrolase
VSARVVSAELRVRYAETDQMGVVYHANYLVWCEVGRTEFIRAAGRSYASLEADGVMLAVSEMAIRFRAPARYDDAIRVDTTLREVRSRSLVFDYSIVNRDSGVVLVTAHSALVSLGTDGQIVALPPAIRDWLLGARDA